MSSRESRFYSSMDGFAEAKRAFYEGASVAVETRSPNPVSALPYLAAAIGIFLCMLTLLLSV